MGLLGFLRNKQQKDNNVTQISSGITMPQSGFAYLPVYNHIVSVDCFNTCFKRYDDLQIKIGDRLQIVFMPSAISNSLDAVICIENKKLGYLPHKEEKWLRLFYGKNENSCVVEDVKFGDENELFVNIKLPYKNKDINLPLQVKLVGVTFEDRQHTLKQSVIGDILTIKHEPTTEYPNTLKVYNQRLNKCIGVVPDDTATKYIKKYKQDCNFSGVIYSLFGGNGNQNIGVDIVVLDNLKES